MVSSDPRRTFAGAVCVVVWSAVVVLGGEPVRKLDFRQVPEMKQLGEHARELGNEVYPRIVPLLWNDPKRAPGSLDIRFETRVKLPEFVAPDGALAYVGWKGRTIHLDGTQLKFDSGDFDRVLVHEMAHVAQRYSIRAPEYLVEGVADYVCFKLGYTNGNYCAECSNTSPHYRSGYRCTGAFPLYLDSVYGSDVVIGLCEAMRHWSYSDAYFARATGKEVEELWADFKGTAAYKASADEAIAFFRSMGLSHGVGMREMKALVKKQTGGKETLSAQRFLTGLLMKRELPGFRPGEDGPQAFSCVDVPQVGRGKYPIVRVFDSTIEQRPVAYHYEVVQRSRFTSWKLARVWATDERGFVISEF